MASLPDALFVGVDIGGTSVETVVAGRSSETLFSGVHPTDAKNAEGVLASTIAAIREVLADAAPEAGRIAAIGVGIPGQVDVETGVVSLAVNLNIGSEGFRIGPALAEEFGTSVSVENDVRAAAVGAYEALRGKHRDLHVLAYLSIGTGIAAGIVIDGRLHRGRHGMAGEIGHVVASSDGPECKCGLQGCLETVAAGPAIERMWRSTGRPADDLFQAAAEGNPDAIEVAETVAGHLARAIHWLAISYGTDLVVLGGGVGSVAGLQSAIRAQLGRLSERSELCRRMIPPERLLAMPAGFPTGAIGAAALARRRLEGEAR